MPLSKNALMVGIDVGTSGCRAIAIDSDAHIVAEARTPLPEPLRLDGGGAGAVVACAARHAGGTA
jgi:sugar (pentulose or hexulose) kinase